MKSGFDDLGPWLEGLGFLGPKPLVLRAEREPPTITTPTSLIISDYHQKIIITNDTRSSPMLSDMYHFGKSKARGIINFDWGRDRKPPPRARVMVHEVAPRRRVPSRCVDRARDET